MDAHRKSRKFTQIRRKFGAKIKLFRLKLQLTQEELAELSDLHPTYIGSVERGERNISLENIAAIAKGLNCSIRDLFY